MQYAEGRGGGEDNNNLYKKMPKPMLHKLGLIGAKTPGGSRERKREENENKDTGATETPTKRGAERGGDTSAQTLSDRFTLVATSSLQ